MYPGLIRRPDKKRSFASLGGTVIFALSFPACFINRFQLALPPHDEVLVEIEHHIDSLIKSAAGAQLPRLVCEDKKTSWHGGGTGIDRQKRRGTPKGADASEPGSVLMKWHSPVYGERRTLVRKVVDRVGVRHVADQQQENHCTLCFGAAARHVNSPPKSNVNG
jgi:hypothetical protein